MEPVPIIQSCSGPRHIRLWDPVPRGQNLAFAQQPMSSNVSPATTSITVVLCLHIVPVPFLSMEPLQLHRRHIVCKFWTMGAAALWTTPQQVLVKEHHIPQLLLMVLIIFRMLLYCLWSRVQSSILVVLGVVHMWILTLCKHVQIFLKSPI